MPNSIQHRFRMIVIVAGLVYAVFVIRQNSVIAESGETPAPSSDQASAANQSTTAEKQGEQDKPADTTTAPDSGAGTETIPNSRKEAPVRDEHRVSLEVARDRAQLMHNIFLATLDTMHHRYFLGERATVPARAMEDVFSEMKRQSGVRARWISINTKPMSIDHEPKSDFEKKAVRELGPEKDVTDLVEDGFYRRAAVVPLTGGCLSCHDGMFKAPSRTPRFAGLVISVPLLEQSSGP